ncbi:IclR family transcriptional regulator [Pararhizobium mangrovi]|uniref:IclR family transcriptional regulator n=1 Tax=Pararhizobium mangrovi TaxID=2590452 RepID=A0A506TYJ6_9HYPH|nr:IclR family transcriptional regulator [Pararhizobium mangrovi]TPW26278.1 IclR family transcriptional regulator [Pararhizobium mangrovi]
MVQSVERALEILECIAHAGGAAHLNEIARETRLKPTTAHNILKTLHALGYVRRREKNTRYYLGDRILNLARVAGNDSGLRRTLRPALEAMAEQTGETVFVAVPSGDEVYFLDAIESLKPLKAASQEGQRTPMVGSAIGLLFLAHIPSLRRRMLGPHADRIGPSIDAEIDATAERGYALDQENYLPGLNCVAVPWIDDGEVRAGFGLSGPTRRLPLETLTELAETMSGIVARI